MLKRLLSLQELSLELSSDLGTYNRLLDTIGATKEFESEVISTESSSPFMRAVGLGSGTKVDKFKLIGHLDNIMYTVAQDMYRKQSQFNSLLIETTSYLKGHLSQMSRTIDSNKTVVYTPDMYSQQTMVVNNQLLEKDSFFVAVNKFLSLFKKLTDTHSEYIVRKASTDLHTTDPGYGIAILMDIPNNVSIPNNTKVSYKRKPDGKFEWKAVYKRSHVNKDVQIRLTKKDIEYIYQLVEHSVELLENSTKHDHLNYRSGSNSDKKTYDLVYKMYVDLYIALIRVIFVLMEMYSTFEKTVEVNNV